MSGKRDKVCGNCLNMRAFMLCDYGFCRLDNYLHTFNSCCPFFKEDYTLKELKKMEEERKND